MPDKAKWISDSASTSPPFTTSSWCTLPRKNSMHWGPTSMTARSAAGADREMKVGWKGQVGGPAGSVCGASANRAWAASPSHSPTLATAPFPTHNTWSTLGRSQLDKSPATSRASLGGMASKCVVLAWWCLCRGSGVHKLKEPPAAHPWSRGGQAIHDGGWWPPSAACPPDAAEWCPSAPPPPPPGPSPPAPPPGSPLTSRGSYSGGSPPPPCRRGGGRRGGWSRRCGGAAAHSPHWPQ